MLISYTESYICIFVKISLLVEWRDMIIWSDYCISREV